MFAPNVGDKNARTTLIEFATNQGWLLDLTATRNRHAWREDTKEQDPNQFVRVDPNGGHWVVALDYEVKGDPEAYRPYREWDNTLRGMTLWHTSWVDDKGRRRRSMVLKNYHQANSARAILWDITDPDQGAGFKPLRKRAEEILRNPDLAVWFVEERKHREIEAEQARQRRVKEQYELRNRPLSVAVSQDHFREMARQLRSAGTDLVNANGLTDLQEIVARAEKVIADIRLAVGNPENQD